jgi:hypothetical protein
MNQQYSIGRTGAAGTVTAPPAPGDTAEAAGASLAGVWRLASFHDVGEGGERLPGPLGPDPEGLLVYSALGHLSVTMMRTGEAPDAAPGARPPATYMSYAGEWHREGDRVHHRITLAPDPAWLGTVQTRDLRLDGDTLTLYGDALVGRPQLRVLEWHRADAARTGGDRSQGLTGTAEGGRR